MAKKLQTQHPLLMTPFVHTFSVVVYSNQGNPAFSLDPIRDALIAQLPKDCGLGSMHHTNHGVYEAPRDVEEGPLK